VIIHHTASCVSGVVGLKGSAATKSRKAAPQLFKVLGTHDLIIAGLAMPTFRIRVVLREIRTAGHSEPIVSFSLFIRYALSTSYPPDASRKKHTALRATPPERLPQLSVRLSNARPPRRSTQRYAHSFNLTNPGTISAIAPRGFAIPKIIRNCCGSQPAQILAPPAGFLTSN
jgi:hypothetical protein